MLRWVGVASLVGLLGLVVIPGCTTENGTDSTDEGEEGDIAETRQAITYNEWNRTCAQSLTVRNAPAGQVIATLSKGTLVYPVWPPTGSWVKIYVLNSGISGWALKGENGVVYISKSCP